MVKCPTCGAALDDGARFCIECGTKIEVPAAPAPAAPAANICPNCKATLKAGAAFCHVCGTPAAKRPEAAPAPASAPAAPAPAAPAAPAPAPAPAAPAPAAPAYTAPTPAPKTPKENKPLNTKLIAGIVGGVAVVALVVLLFVSFAGGSGKVPNYAYYVKEKELFSSDFSKSGAKQITTRLLDDDLDMGEDIGGFGSFCAISKDGKYIFFPDKVSSTGFALYYRTLGNIKKEPVKIDSNVEEYAVNDAATAVTYLKDGNLYQYNMKKDDKEKLASNVYAFYVSDDGKSVIYRDDEGTVYSLTVGKDKEKLASEVDRLWVAKDLKTIHYMKEGTLYEQVVGKEKEKIASDLYSVLRILSTGEIYYINKNEDGGKLSDYIYDDMKDADAAMTEPEYPSAWDDASTEAYNKAWDAYSAKMNRDWLREQLEDWQMYSTSYELCYFDGKDKTVLSDAFTYYNGAYDYAVDAPVFAFTAYNNADFDKIKLSEADYAWELEDMVEEALSASAKLYVANGKNVAEIAAENVEDVTLTDDGKTVYILADYDYERNEFTLYSAEVTKNGAKDPKKLDSEVYGYGKRITDKGEIIYFKDVKDYKGTMYLGGKKVDDDVDIYSLIFHEDSGKMAYTCDWNDSKGYGTLKVYNGKKAEKVAEDVHSFAFAPDGNLMYLVDYSMKNSRGDLYLMKGNKATKIDEDVTAILKIGNGKYHDYY